jgi:hypothetical protein
MFLWSFKTRAVADPPSMSDVQIQAPHLEGDLSGYAVISLFPTNPIGYPGSWTGPFSGSARVLALGFGGGSFPGPFDPFRVGEIHGSYHFTTSLRDEASHAVGALTFVGRFDGLVGNGNLRLVSHMGPTAQELHLGTNLYTVTMNPFQARPDGIASDVPSYYAGKIDASINVRPFTTATPEPSTLCLAVLGLIVGCGPVLHRLIRRR